MENKQERFFVNTISAPLDLFAVFKSELWGNVNFRISRIYGFLVETTINYDSRGDRIGNLTRVTPLTDNRLNSSFGTDSLSKPVKIGEHYQCTHFIESEMKRNHTIKREKTNETD